MTKIQSVEERVEEFEDFIAPALGYVMEEGEWMIYGLDGVPECPAHTKDLDEALNKFKEALAADRLALLTELREWVDENLTTCDSYDNASSYQMVDPDNLKAHLDELIKSNSI